jgi:hypothetical protein
MRQRLLLYLFLLMMPAASVFSVTAFTQDPAAPSVAEAARRAREQKQSAPKPSKVITDDTLHPQSSNAAPTETNSTSPSNPQSNAVQDSTDTGARKEAAAAQDASQQSDRDKDKKKELEALKQEIAGKQAEIDLSQRELALANDSYYSKPDFSNDRDGKAKLDAMQSDLNAKKDDLAKLKAKFADLGGVEDVKPPAPPAPMVPARP